MFLHSLTHYFLYSSVRSRSAKTSIDIKTSQCCGVFFKIFLSSNAEVATTLHLFCQNIVCVSAAKKLRTDPHPKRQLIATKQSFRTTVNILKLVCKRHRQKTAAVIHRLLLLFFVPLHRKKSKIEHQLILNLK